MYWEQGFDSAPDIVKKCRESWIVQNPEWQVISLDRRDIPDGFIEGLEPEIFCSLPVQMRSDLVRLKLLLEDGGVWADSTCFCAEPLDHWLLEAASSGLFMFSRPGRDREISNWFVVAEARNYLLEKLFKSQVSFWQKHEFHHNSPEFKKRRNMIARFLNRNRITPMLWFSPVMTRFLKVYPYFVFHYLFYRMLLTDAKARRAWARVPKIKAVCCILPQRLGLLKQIEPTGISQLQQCKSPVYKLNHHVPNNAEIANTYLEWVLSNTGTV